MEVHPQFSEARGNFMVEIQAEQAFKEKLKALCPLVDNIRLMIAAARHAFNRHSPAQLEEMARRQKALTLDIDPFIEEVEEGLKKGSAEDRPYLLKLQNILSHLELMADRVASLADHLRYKANHGVILSEQDFFTVNDLFSQLTGFMRVLVDIFEINDADIKAYILQESQKLTDIWFKAEAEHRTRMMDTPGQPGAWSVFLAILERSREIAGHLADIIKSLDWGGN
jgi:Na+/phosphate symporter